MDMIPTTLIVLLFIIAVCLYFVARSKVGNAGRTVLTLLCVGSAMLHAGLIEVFPASGSW